jgi:hypothetical protein
MIDGKGGTVYGGGPIEVAHSYRGVNWKTINVGSCRLLNWKEMRS